MKTVYKNNITMDPSGFVLLADFVPHRLRRNSIA